MAVEQKLEDKNTEQQAQETGPQQLSTGATGPQPGATAPGGAPSYKAPERKGSGRFMNLQKYLQANVGAGERMKERAGGIIGRPIQEKQEDIQTRTGDIRAGIEAARGEQQAGQEYLEQLRQPGFQAQQFTQQPGFDRFTALREGRGIDEAALQRQAQEIGTQRETGLAEAQRRQEQLGTEAGRFGLLREMYGGGPTGQQYSTGQRRLDQLMLQASGGDPLRQLQQQAAQQARSFEEQAAEQAQIQQQVGDIAAQEQALVGDIGTRTGELMGQFRTGLETQLPEIQQQREQAYQSMLQAIGTGQFTPEQMAQLGLTEGQETYGLFQPGVLPQAEALVTQGMRPSSIQDIATAEDIERYQALSQIAGTEPGLLTQAGDIGEAFTVAQGPESVRGLLEQRGQQFQEHMGQMPGTISSSLPTTSIGRTIDNPQEGYQLIQDLESGRYGSDWPGLIADVRAGQYRGTAGEEIGQLMNWLNRYETYAPGRTLQAATGDLETGGQFNIV